MAEDRKISLADSPEFKAAVADAVAAAAPKIAAAAVAEMSKQGKSGVVDGATEEFFANMSQTIAMAVAEISDQGTHRKRVAPEILAKRADAQERCHALIKKARREGLSPEYKLINKIYFGERLIEPWRRDSGSKIAVQQEIAWAGEPNGAMLPINKVAEEIYDAWVESVGAAPRLKTVRLGDGVATQDDRPVWMTPGGLVVKGDAPPRYQLGSSPLGNGMPQTYENGNPDAPEVRILGTIHPAARRTGGDAPFTQRAG